MELTLDEVARATGGRVVGDPDLVVAGASIDSRTVRPGQLFVAVGGERDGHEFVAAARAEGAAAALVRAPTDDGPSVVVAEPTTALTALGGHARDRLDATVVGVTGSVGKTSLKDLAAAAARPSLRTSASVRSFNNELGVPLTLLGAPADTEVAIVEMGARGTDHITVLCAIARPTVGVVTAVSLAHTEAFGSIDEVARAKAELVSALPAGGTAVLNAGDPRVAAMAAATEADVLTYGVDRGDVRATSVEVDDELRPRLRLATPWGTAELRLSVRGRHNAENAAGAAAAALVAGADFDGVIEGLAAAELSPWRMELGVTPAGARILNDAYNANPTSMVAALEALVALDAERRTAVLGVMAELGPAAEDEHRRVAAMAAELGVRLIAVDAPAYGAEAAADLDAAAALLGDLGPGDAVLVKASRVAGLERLAERLLRP
jgi:UDP-N-acetylmuramoyl-tripeptide--D-alanyl-D-alanine ligase